MSFYTALTGLNGSSADISATSNNIANVGTTGFKRSRAEFGDIFATSPLQNASSSIGSGTILKGVKQQFTQGNIAASLNALDLAISGQGFFALKPSLTSTQTVYTRNGSLNVNNDRYVVLGTVSANKVTTLVNTPSELKKLYTLADAVLLNGDTYYICNKILEADWKEVKT